MRKIALVIGLEYSGKYKLNGCYNDALNIISNIKSLYNFSNDEILFINDRKKDLGTKEYIKSCFDHIVSNNHDFIFFYYAGHGSYTYDYDGDEKLLASNFIHEKNSLGKDSYLCTSENDGSIGIFKDDLIKQYLSKINSESKFLGLIDCCHSGTMFDCDYVYFPNKINSKKCKSNKMKYLLNNYSNEYEIHESKYDNPIQNIKGNVVLISAARDNQYSYESFKNGKTQGNFTYNVCRILKKCRNQNISLEKFILTVCGMIDDKKQLTLCTSSYKYDLKSSYIFEVNSRTPIFIKDLNNDDIEIKKEEVNNEIKQDENIKYNSWTKFFKNIFGSSRSLNNNKINYLPYVLATLTVYKYYNTNN